MKKKPKLLTSLMGGGKRRHHVAAFVTQEGEWNRHEPNTGFARVFIAMLILHVFIIGGIILSDFSSSPKSAQRSPAAAALMTKPSTELSSSRSHPAPSPSRVDDATSEKYTVGSGDSLPSIVARFGVDKDELIQLNHLDQNGEFSAGTVLLIPSKKVTEPLHIVAARNLHNTGTKPPTDNVGGREQTVASTSTATPETTASAEASTTTSTNVIASGDSPPVPSATPISAGADGTPTLVPLPEIPSDTAAPVVSTSTADTTPAAEKKPDADAPPESHNSTADKPVAVKKPQQPEKPVHQKPVVAASQPKPVPPPSEMSKRPITKPDATPKTQNKTTPAKAAGGTHILAKGETLYRLSAQYGVSVQSLIKANNIKDAAKLREGTKLVIPAK